SSYSQKWKHAIEPEITFHYVEDVPEKNQIIQIDDVDFPIGERDVTYSVTNLLYAKRPVKEEEEYKPDEYQFYNPKPEEQDTPWELVSWKIEQSYRLNSDSFNLVSNPGIQRFSPVTSTLRINPSVNYSIQFVTAYDVKFKQVTSIQLQSTLRDAGRWYSNITFAYSNPSPSVIDTG